MLRSLYSSASGLTAQQFNLDVVAHNLANVSTMGFKKSRADFADVVSQTIAEAGSQTGPNSQLPTGTRVGLGVSIASTVPIETVGTPIVTGQSTDMAITGQGYFSVQLPDGTVGYTRDGSFRRDSTGKLVNSQGFALQPEVIIPGNASNVTIAPDGNVNITLPGQNTTQSVGQIKLTSFVNPSGLRNIGKNILMPTSASGNPTTDTPGQNGLGAIEGGSLEGSNVDIVEEMIRMIILQRAYDANSKSIQAADEMLQTTNSLKR